ncbi:unnamed protein product, partial [Rotaria magnacalcarata]
NDDDEAAPSAPPATVVSTPEVVFANSALNDDELPVAVKFPGGD